ncbi:MAG: hypothetical protein AVDCRST_MAG90-687, partial [uncultured Microvirga sp.]
GRLQVVERVVQLHYTLRRGQPFGEPDRVVDEPVEGDL